jgi:predicted AAA+ superfamily ATPase
LVEKGISHYRQLLSDKKILIIDEAQKITQIGRILKIMIDEIEGLKIVVTGSSVFDLANILGEPLTGRKYTYYLYPFAQCELKKYENVIETRSNLEDRLIFGSYPEVLKFVGIENKLDYLTELLNSYLLKDILVLENIKNSSKLFNILRLIAFQIGSEVSMSEIGNQVGLDKNTVEKYLDLLTKVFIIFKVEGFSKNLRKEISKSSRYYFWDNGVRNHLVANFNLLELRNDTGQLWENYIVSERRKWQACQRMISNNYFWRTYDKQEIDWVEERGGQLFAYEIKYHRKKTKIPSAWKTAYPNSLFKVVNVENYLDFIT